MTDFTKTMAGTAVGIGSIALVGESLKMIPKDFGIPKKGKKQKVKQTPFVKGAANLMIGTALLGGASSIVNKL